MLNNLNKELALKVLWFAVVGVVMLLRVYDYLSMYEGLGIFVIYTLIHVLVIEKLVLGKLKIEKTK